MMKSLTIDTFTHATYVYSFRTIPVKLRGGRKAPIVGPHTMIFYLIKTHTVGHRYYFHAIKGQPVYSFKFHSFIYGVAVIQIGQHSCFIASLLNVFSNGQENIIHICSLKFRYLLIPTLNKTALTPRYTLC